ncbi:MAG: sigma-70 family RNA polymerase sigma factor, partial [Flavobacterium sp.]|nr:sigma-70 family RNA polymerase sigma factor [Flavobacterium sp.]
QEILVKLWSKNENFEKYNSIEAFAMTMTKNYCLDQLKSKRSNNLRLVNDNFDNNQANLQKKLEDEDSLKWVEKIMEHLPDQQKLILQMREIEQYEFDEIATILDMNPTAVRVALSRARKTVREKMTQTHSYGTN